MVLLLNKISMTCSAHCVHVPAAAIHALQYAIGPYWSIAGGPMVCVNPSHWLSKHSQGLSVSFRILEQQLGCLQTM